MPKVELKKTVVYSVASVFGVFIVVLGGYTWNSHRFQQWAFKDAGDLSPYPITLVSSGEQHETLKEIDHSLVESTMEGRWVVELTRSEYRRSLLGKRAWVKTHLVTARSGEMQPHQETKLLNRLDWKGSNWVHSHVEELTLP